MFKKSVIKYILFSIIFGLILGVGIGFVEDKVYGSECEPVYGGGEVCPKVANLLIDKQVYNPDSEEFVDNLTENDHRFSANDIVTFRIVIENTGETTINSINITDTFPSYVNFLSGVGRLEDGNLIIDLGDLEAGDSQEFFIRGQVVGTDDLPGDKTLICPVNRVQVTGEVDDDITASDASQLCIEKQVLGAEEEEEEEEEEVVIPPVIQLPAAGAPAIVIASLTLAGVGFFLRKYTK